MQSRMEAPLGADVSSVRSVVLASADRKLRERLRSSLTGMRWSVREAAGGAEAMACLDTLQPEALLLDHWLPDLEISELEGQIPKLYPGMDLLRMNGDAVHGAQKCPRRDELQQALREVWDTDWEEGFGSSGFRHQPRNAIATVPGRVPSGPAGAASLPRTLPGMVGQSEPMLELTRLVQLVAPRSTTVLIEGETGTGKEVVAHALHRLSARSAKPFVVLNCAAIPEALLEAELFGHARGAFTGAVGARVGRIEAAHGGTLFLDEIGEMPLALQAKLLRFLECGELQRVGDNDVTRVDVRVIAATHQHLEERSEEGTFRLDLYHRLAVFPLDVPPLRERREDIAALAEHFLERLTKGSGRKQLMPAALSSLLDHPWPGNVRELAHVLERAVILAADETCIDVPHLRFRRRERSLGTPPASSARPSGFGNS